MLHVIVRAYIVFMQNHLYAQYKKRHITEAEGEAGIP